MLHPAVWALGFVNLSTHLPYFRIVSIYETSQKYSVSTTRNIPIRNLIPQVYRKLIRIDFNVTSKEHEFRHEKTCGIWGSRSGVAEGFKSSGM
jgi:hypothetical protein